MSFLRADYKEKL